MDTFIGLLLFGGLIGAVVLWQKFTGAVSGAVGTKINQTVTPKSFKAGQTLAAETHMFEVKATLSEVTEAIVAGITAKDRTPAVKAGLYLVQSRPGLVVYDYANKLQTWFRFVVSFETSGEGVQGIYKFGRCLESDGMVLARKEMRQLNADTEAVLRRLDPGASITVMQD